MEIKRFLKQTIPSVLIPAVLWLGYGELSYDPYSTGGCPKNTQSEEAIWYASNIRTGQIEERIETICVDGDTGERITGSCCCFVAGASLLSPEQIESLRNIHSQLQEIPYFTKTISTPYYTDIGPQIASWLRENPLAQRAAHDVLAPAADIAHLVDTISP